MPWFSNISFLLRAILPVPLFDFISKLLGGHDTMDDFKGRHNAPP